MKRIVNKKIISSIIVVILIITSIVGAANILKRKDSCYKNDIYYDNPKQYNVLFFGSSHMNGAVMPRLISDEYNIASYNLAGNSLMIPTNYWIIKDAIERSNPELVVLDCYRVEMDEKIHPWENNNIPHNAIDSLPLSKNKIQMIFDLTDDSKERLEYILPLSLYHNNWKNLKSEDFYKDVIDSKTVVDSYGYELRPEARQWSTYRKEKLENVQVDSNSVGFEYLRRIINLCNNKNVELLLTYIPYSASKEEQAVAQKLELLSMENNIKYLNMLDSNIVDYESDFSDKDHVNYLGSLKITKYLGKYIKENYKISDSGILSIDSDKQTIDNSILSNLREANEITTFITLLNYEKIDFELYIPENSNVYKDKFITKLLLELIKYRNLDENIETFVDCVENNSAMIVSTIDQPHVFCGIGEEISSKIIGNDLIAIIKDLNGNVLFNKKIAIGFDESTVTFIEEF